MSDPRIDKALEQAGLSYLKPYEVLWLSEEDGVAVVRLRTGVIEVLPIDEGVKLILDYGDVGVRLWVFALGGEDWVIFRLIEDRKLEIYWVDNWDLILKGLKKFEPFEVLSVERAKDMKI